MRIAALSALLLAAALCSAPGHAGSLVINALDKADAPMADAVVYALPVGRKAPPAPATPPTVILAQENSEFVPYVLPVRLGTLVSFENRDKHEHHIKSFGPAKEFEFKISASGSQGEPVLFDKVGNSVIVCYLHGWMRAHVHTVDTPWFAKTDASGLARIGDIPDGEYEIKAWHPDMFTAALSYRVTVRDGAPVLGVKFEHVPRKRSRPAGK